MLPTCRARFVGLVAAVVVDLMPGDQAPTSIRDADAAPHSATVRGAPVYPRHRIHVLERRLQYWLRGDWEPPDAVFFAFTEQWRDSLAYLAASALDQAEIHLLVDPAGVTESRIQQWLAEFNLPSDDIHVRWIRLDTPWVRDYGPLQLTPATGDRGDTIWLDAKYAEARPRDDAVPSQLAAQFGVQSEALPFRFDGGALISNGRGLCATTIEYLLDKGFDLDDPALMDDRFEQVGCQIVALLPALDEDATKHVDMFAQFLATDEVAVARVDGAESAADAARMDEAALGLADAAERIGVGVRVVRVPMPYLGAGRYLTYVNGLRLAGDFVTPSYKEAPENIQASAYEILADALPGTNVVPVPADRIVPFSGSLHCISLGVSLPAAGRLRRVGTASD